MIIEEDDYLAHYGILRRSGRYPWGSGGPENNTGPRGFLDTIDYLHKQGLSPIEICKAMLIGTFDRDGNFKPSTTQLRAAKSIAKTEVKLSEIAQAQRLRDEGYSNPAIGKIMGKNESSIRALLAPGAKDKAEVLMATSKVLKDSVAEKKYLDVGAGVETQLGISTTKLNNAIAVLREEGYTVHYVPVRQLGTGKDTTIKVLAAPGVTYSEVARNKDSIRQIQNFSEDGGRSFLGIHPPVAIDPKRVGVIYAEDGGADADGVIYVRPGVEDVSLGQSRYAQVRIQVGDGHYLKGMAMYKDDLPPGVDLMFNTNKSDTGNKLDAFKELKRKLDGSVDTDNPFGSTIESQVGYRESDPNRIIRQLVVRNPDGTERVTSAMNIVNAEGNWLKWSKELSAQMLSKQNPSFAKTQLQKHYDKRVKEYEEISALTNPTVRRKLLEAFGDSVDADAVDLKAHALNRSMNHVILPVTSLKDNEVYAPNYEDGERVVLIRFPHGGKFEIPDLVVNNKHPEGKRLLGDAKDAVGINPRVAERLSGADFDGDHVLVIPNKAGKIKIDPALEDLKGFDPRRLYKLPDDVPKMKSATKQRLMGEVTNLITDMSLQGASPAELARAVKHSMVVIDAEKHHLNYKLSAQQNGIAALKEKYQGAKRAGAATLLSRASAGEHVPERKERSAAKGGPINRETGKREYEPTGRTYVDSKGNTKLRTDKVARMYLTDDAYTLVSRDGIGTPMERVYADHANKMKALANKARRESVNTPKSVYSPSARKTYATEVASLDSKLAIVQRNRPLERQAQVIGNATYKRKLADNPDLDDDQKKRLRFQAMAEARTRTGAGKPKFVLSEREWDAIQAGAVHDSKLQKILQNADLDVIKTLATPRPKRLMSPSNVARAKTLLAGGATRAEVASILGVSLSTLDLATVGEEEGWEGT